MRTAGRAGIGALILLIFLSSAGATSPSITRISPTVGPVSPVGSSVTIIGAGFGAAQGSSAVNFGVVTGAPTSWSDGRITVPVPSSLLPGSVDVSATVDGISSNAQSFFVIPVITRVSPSSGAVGSSIVITGTSFGDSQGASTLTLNGTPAVLSSWSNTNITASIPVGATSGPVVVTINGIATNGVSLRVAPSIANIAPVTGAPGTVVRITGSNFGTAPGNSIVQFAGVNATPSGWGATSITVPVPNGATTGNVVVTVDAQSSNGVLFTIVPLAMDTVITPRPNANGWNSTGVTVSYTCSGGVAPVNCPTSQTATNESAGQVVTATATDAAGGNVATSVLLKIDKTAPTISTTISPLPDGNGVIHAASATVVFACTDALSGVASCPSPVTVTTAGLQTIDGTAADIAGNTAVTSVQLNLQTFAPLAITASAAPSPNPAGWNNTPVTVTFQCTGGAPPVSCPGAQTVSVDGDNQVVSGTATDVNGSSATASTAVKLDQTQPLVTIISPTDGTVIDSATVAVSGGANDGLSGLAIVTCNGAAASLGNGNFTCSVQITQGALSIIVKATDVAGNSASATAGVVLAGPNLTIDSPAALDLFGSSPITITGTVSDPVALVTVNGVHATNSGSTFTAGNVPLREGNNLITATGINAGGGVGTATVNVVLDTTPPTVSIDSPSDKAVVTSPQITVTGLVNDAVTGTVNAAQVSVTVNGIKADVANRSFMASNVLLVPGQNVINVVAKDRGGNLSQSHITVSLQDLATQQRILMVSGNSQSAGVGSTLPQPLVVQVVNALGQPLSSVPVTFTVAKSDGQLSAFPQQGRQVTAQTDVNGQVSINFQLGSRVGNGNNQVAVTAPGFVGELMFSASSQIGPPVQIHDVSGGSQKGVVGQPLPEPFVAGVFDVGGNPVAGVPVVFKVEQGGGTLEGNVTTTKITDADGRAAVVLVLAQEEGINNNSVSASISGLTGMPATFTASGLTPGGTATRVSGVVLDNANQPIPNVTASIQGSNLSALTNSQGQFTITNAPVGSIILFIDGSTSTRPESFPFLEFPLVTVTGQDNTLSGPIYLPVLDMENSKVVGGDEDVVLTMKGAPGVAYTVFAHSATFPDGSRVGRLTLSQVHGDKVPMAPPNGTSPALVGTLQPARVKFNPPIRMQVPNSSGLPPGQVVEVYSFDHDLEQFVSGGTARVSEDGSVIVSDSGFGLRASGWHAAPPPPPPPTCVNGCDDKNECTSDSCVKGACQHTPVGDGTACKSDRDACTTDVCKGGSCQHDPPKAPKACCEDKGVFSTSKQIYDTTNQCCAKGKVLPKTPIKDLDDCPSKVQNSRPHEFDGCSLPDWLVQKLGLADKDNPAGGRDTRFSNGSRTGACDVHDTCYQTCVSGDKSARKAAKTACDTLLLTTAIATCDASQETQQIRDSCRSWANHYHTGVDWGGGSAYDGDQKEWCDCCK